MKEIRPSPSFRPAGLAEPCFAHSTTSPREPSEVLRFWLTLYPEKILFVTDTSPGTPGIGRE